MPAPSKSARSVSRKGYCLYCFHRLLDAHGRCEVCGKTSLPSQRAQYWTRRRWNRSAELVSKVLAGASLPVGTLATQAAMPGSMTGRGWLFLFPLLFSVALWKTGENWTQHNPYFRARIVWGFAFVGLGLVCVFVDWRFAGGFFVAAAIVELLSRAGEQWKRRLRERGGGGARRG